MLGDNIRKIRISRNIKLNDFAKNNGLSPGYLSDLENNKVNNPTKSKLDLIAKGLGVPVAELLKDNVLIQQPKNKMSLEDGINYYNDCLKCIENDDNKNEYVQLLEWLIELKELREFKDIVIKGVKTIS